MDWIINNLANIIIIIIIFAAVIIALKKIYSNHINEKTSCGGHCNGCTYVCFKQRKKRLYQMRGKL